jgi:hypothetical protein
VERSSLINKLRWLLAMVVVFVALAPSDAIAQRRPRSAELDTLMRHYWIAAVSHDAAGLDSVIVGEQPRLVLGAFVEGSGAVTRADAERIIARKRPPMRFQGDTVWRTYAVRVGDLSHGRRDYVARFERRCGQWRIAAISSVRAPR